ncbi:hypothetical protein CR152_16640 [Massilia violaceinigra]|uniref:DUF2145 domain-containing protein n=1 Tax=Massilia violaceinigra TaxID=2045208 RepID=A0A2D2DM02_9BURK|nr:DUF2145 domain-containing protein [Massilia violaceinigra]ATQ75981.1 hypothetical protein CR152_16640 [Massilia violaceinigra]
MTRIGQRFLLLLVLAMPLQFAHAGTACEEVAQDATAFVKAVKLAENTSAALDASGAEVALIARVGQDLSKYDLRYSHMAYTWRDHPKGRWTVVHLLNQCGTAKSKVFDQGLANFFLDDLFAYESQIVIPSAQSQKRIVAMLASQAPARLHGENYNMLAFPFSPKYQNSNQWVLETYAASASDTAIDDRGAAQSWLKQAGYTPNTIWVPSVKRLGARVFRANVAFDDHPMGRRIAGQIDIVTVESVVRFVKKRDPGTTESVVGIQ